MSHSSRSSPWNVQALGPTWWVKTRRFPSSNFLLWAGVLLRYTQHVFAHDRVRASIHINLLEQILIPGFCGQISVCYNNDLGYHCCIFLLVPLLTLSSVTMSKEQLWKRSVLQRVHFSNLDRFRPLIKWARASSAFFFAVKPIFFRFHILIQISWAIRLVIFIKEVPGSNLSYRTDSRYRFLSIRISRSPLFIITFQ